MMFKCDNCGEIFSDDEIKRTTEKIGEFWGSPAYIDSYSCPYCENEEYHEVKECKICENYSEDMFCEDCKEKIGTKFKDFYFSFLPEERELLRETMEEFNYENEQ